MNPMIDTEKTSEYNIIMINLDGLRRDKVQFCDSLKSLIDESYFFSEMNTVVPYTFASIHAIMSGMYPSSNGVDGYYKMFKFKNNSVTTIAEVLKKFHYFTSCDINSESILTKKGFDEYEVYDEKIIDFTDRHTKIIKKLSKRKFFLFLQNTETHNNLVREIIKNDKENIANDYFTQKENNDLIYNSHLSKTDSYVKSIVKTLKDLDIYENTILIIFSDHGTSIGEKLGEKFYGVFLYDYTLNVFSIIHLPYHSPKIIDKQCRTIDLFPTILELSDIPKTEFSEKQGESLIPLISDINSPDREVFAETGGLYGPWPSPEKHNVFCIKYNQKKLIYNNTPKTWEFYDLKKDPDEKNNIFDEHSKIISQFKKRLIFYLEENNISTNIS
jgi:arylsulfatase A-like enzyme